MHFSNPRKSLVYIEHHQLQPDIVQSTTHVNLKYCYNFYKENESKLWSILLKVYITIFHQQLYQIPPFRIFSMWLCISNF